MNVVTSICLDKYSPYQIIQFVEDGIVTVDEVIASGVSFRCFSNVLSDFLYEKSKEAIFVLDLGFVA